MKIVQGAKVGEVECERMADMVDRGSVIGMVHRRDLEEVPCNSMRAKPGEVEFEGVVDMVDWKCGRLWSSVCAVCCQCCRERV